MEKEKPKLILIVAGEASSDLHAANLVKAIKDIQPQIQFFGLGGENLKEQGVKLHFDIVQLAVVGFFEVLKNLKKFKAIFDGILKEVDSRKPDLSILVDYPGFNLRLGAQLKKRGIPVVYYISPQVWAWGEKRIKAIKKLVRLMLVTFKFEERLYQEQGVPAIFVGHPLLDIVRTTLSKEEFCSRFGLDLKKFTFALLPGSREKEVKLLLPIMLETAKIIYREQPESQFLILRSPAVKQQIFNRLTSQYQLPVVTVSDTTYNGLGASDFALVASGTATLETAILGIPMVVIYKVSFLTWALLKMAIKIPYVGLVNVIRQEKFIAEFIQYDACPKKISRYIIDILKDKPRLKVLKQGLLDTVSGLGEEGASRKAARLVVDLLK